MKLDNNFSVSGRVEIFKRASDGHEEKIWDNHNIIVDGGRQVIAAIIGANLASELRLERVRDYRFTFLRAGSGSYESVDGSISELRNPISEYIPKDEEPTFTVTSSLDTSKVDLGGNVVTWKFTLRNISDTLFNITELGLYTANKILIAYEPILGTSVSSEIDMVLIVKWTITIK